MEAEKKKVQACLVEAQQESESKALTIKGLEEKLSVADERIQMLEASGGQIRELQLDLEKSQSETTTLLGEKKDLEEKIAILEKEITTAGIRELVDHLQAKNEQLDKALISAMEEDRNLKAAQADHTPHYEPSGSTLANDNGTVKSICSNNEPSIHVTVNLSPVDAKQRTRAQKLRAALPTKAVIDLQGSPEDIMSFNKLMEDFDSEQEALRRKILELEHVIRGQEVELATLKAHSDLRIKNLQDELIAKEAQYDLNVIMLREYGQKLRELHKEKQENG